jgi:hypothetical protein
MRTFTITVASKPVLLKRGWSEASANLEANKTYTDAIIPSDRSKGSYICENQTKSFQQWELVYMKHNERVETI